MINHYRRRRSGTALVLLVLCNGCALLTKSEPLTPRYFSAEPSEARTPDPATVHGAPTSATAPAPELRIGRVTSASYLGERIVFRNSNTELGFYEDRRWTEKPEAYFRRALSRALFEEGGFRRTVSGGGPTLDVELVEFAELLAPAHVGRARVNFVLYDARTVRTEGTLSVELPIRTAKDGAAASAAVEALSLALDAVVARVVERVSASLVTP